jgi:hypothetical protein
MISPLFFEGAAMHKSFAAKIVSLLSLVGSAWAQTPASPTAVAPVYAVLSLVGDRLEIVGAQNQVGSLLDTSRRSMVEVEDAAIDSAVAAAIGYAVKTAQPKAEISQLNTRSKVLFEKHATLFAENGGVVSIPGAIRDALKAENATHMILVTRQRSAPDPVLARAISGEARLEGLGFLMNGQALSRTVDTNIVNRGYLAAYMHVRVAVVEAASGKIVGSERVVASQAMAPNEIKRVDGMLWDAISTQEKMDALARLIQREMSRAVPSMLKAG